MENCKHFSLVVLQETRVRSASSWLRSENFDYSSIDVLKSVFFFGLSKMDQDAFKIQIQQKKKKSNAWLHLKFWWEQAGTSVVPTPHLTAL